LNYPAAKALPEPVTFGRVSYSDPYRWLEEESPESQAWQGLQDRLTQEWLGSRPSRPRAEALMASMPRLEADFPSHAGGRWFRKRTPEGQKQHVAEVAEKIDGPWRVIIDFNAIGDGKTRTIDGLVPSPDGRKLVYSVGVDGNELAEMHVLDVDTGRKIQDGIRQVRAFFAYWTADSRAFYYVGLDPAVSMYQMRAYRQVVGAEPVTRPEDYEISHSMMWVRPASDGKHLLMIADHLNPRPEFIREEGRGGAWLPFLKGETAQFRGDVIGDRYYAITNDGAACGRLVSIPLATPKDRGTWKELIPGSTDVLATLLVVDGLLVLVDLVDTYSRMRVFDTDGRLKGEIPMPGRGAISASQFALFNMIDMIAKGGSGDVLFPFSTPVQSPALYQASVHTLKVEAVTQPLVRLDAQVVDHFATSADGARVPYHVIARSDVDLRKPQPCAMYGYGGFQAALIPGWAGSWLAAWVKGGGVLVMMHLRGGGELGPDMWHQGRLEHKQNTFNDVFAVGEDLIARGITTQAKLGVVGGSNGGTMAAAVVVQRPDLFRASLSQVPITDVLGRVRDAVSMSATLDYGDPNDPGWRK
jgi:prolyl oligopeptidase